VVQVRSGHYDLVVGDAIRVVLVVELSRQVLLKLLLLLLL